MEQYELNWKNYYEILQVSPNAEPSVITAAYRRLAQTYHPDTTKDTVASARMTNINEAYTVLSDPIRRAAYDRIFKSQYKSQETGIKTPTGETEAEKPTDEELFIILRRSINERVAKGENRSQVEREGVPYAEVLRRVIELRAEYKKAVEGSGDLEALRAEYKKLVEVQDFWRH